jgi:integrase
LLDHGLRVGELAAIKVDNIDINRGLLKFFRPKIGKEQIHRLSRDSLKAVRAYMNFADMPDNGPLLRRSKKDESLSDAGMSDRAITQRVNFLGKKQGLSGLSAHDCRHYWATSAARHGTDPFSLQEAGGWASLAMPRRYVEQNAIANEGIILQNDEEDEE